MAHALGVLDRVRDRQRAALRRPEQRELIELRGIDDRLEVGHEHVERGVGRLALGQAAPARVVAVEAVAGAQRVEPGAPHGRLPVLADVREPVGRAHERITLAVHGIGEPRAVGRAREPNVLRERHPAPRVPRSNLEGHALDVSRHGRHDVVGPRRQGVALFERPVSVQISSEVSRRVVGRSPRARMPRSIRGSICVLMLAACGRVFSSATARVRGSQRGRERRSRGGAARVA